MTIKVRTVCLVCVGVMIVCGCGSKWRNKKVRKANVQEANTPTNSKYRVGMLLSEVKSLIVGEFTVCGVAIAFGPNGPTAQERQTEPYYVILARDEGVELSFNIDGRLIRVVTSKYAAYPSKIKSPQSTNESMNATENADGKRHQQSQDD